MLNTKSRIPIPFPLFPLLATVSAGSIFIRSVHIFHILCAFLSFRKSDALFFAVPLKQSNLNLKHATGSVIFVLIWCPAVPFFAVYRRFLGIQVTLHEEKKIVTLDV